MDATRIPVDLLSPQSTGACQGRGRSVPVVPAAAELRGRGNNARYPAGRARLWSRGHPPQSGRADGMARIGLSHVGLVRTCMISPTEVGETGAGERPWSDVRIRTPTERAAPKAALTRRPAPVLPVGASEIGPGHDAFPSPGRCRAEAGHGPGAPLRIRYRMSPPALWMRSGSYPYLVPIQPKGGVLVSPQEAGFPFAADTRCHSCRHPARAYIEALLAAGCHYRQVRVLLAAMGLWAPSVRCHDGGSPGTARPGGSPSRLVRPADPRRGPRADPAAPPRRLPGHHRRSWPPGRRTCRPGPAATRRCRTDPRGWRRSRGRTRLGHAYSRRPRPGHRARAAGPLAGWSPTRRARCPTRYERRQLSARCAPARPAGRRYPSRIL